MPDISNDDDMRKAVDLAKSLYTPSPNETATQGRILPIKTYESGRVEFDPTAGILGAMTRAVTASGRAMKGEIPLYEINEEGEVVPSRQAIDEAMNVASQVMLGSAPMGVAQTLREGFDPNVIRTFAGPSSKTADLTALEVAQNLEAHGINRDFIWKRTGWGRNPAGQWFYEIPDNELRIRPLRMQDGNYVPRESTIGAEVHHPELFEAYPDLRDMKFRMGDIEGYGGEYMRPRQNYPEFISIGTEEPRGVLTHELGHAVQYREDFPRGGNPEDPLLVSAADIVRKKGTEEATRLFGVKAAFLDDYIKSLNIPKDDIYNKAMAYKSANLRFKELFPKENAQLEQAYIDRELRGPTQAYTRLAGEIQPNIAMKSIDWSPIVRREIPPWQREKTPYTSQIVRTQDGKIFMGQNYRADGGRTGYAGKGAVREDDDVRSALDIARQLEDPANRIEADIRALTQNLSGLDIASAFPAFHTGLPQRPQVGGAGLVPPRPSNIYDKPLTRTGAEVMAKDPILAANPPMMSERGKPLSELQYQYTPRGNLDPWREKHPEELYKEGAYVTGLVGDRSVANILINAIGGTKLTQPTVTSGGGDFTRSEFARGENPAAWASREAAAKTYMNSLREKGVPEGSALYASHTLMGIPSSDSNHMMMQSLLRQIEPTMGKIDRSAAAKVDDFLSARIPGWPGILKPAEAEAFLLKRNIGTETALLAKALDKANAEKGGFPDVGEARFAVTDPRLLSAPQLSSGYALSKIDLSKDPFQPTDMTHLTYPAKIPSVAGYEGGFRYQVPAEIMFPDWAKTLKLTKHGEPQTETQKTRTLQTQNPIQKANQEWLDNVMKFYEGEKRKWGYREGGRTMGNNAVDNALRMARDHFDYGGDVRGGDSPFMSRSDYGLRSAPTPSFREAEDRSMREYNRAIESGWSPTGDRGGSDRSQPSTQSVLDQTLTGRQSGFEGAPPVAMPATIGELLGYNRARQNMLQQQQQQQSAEQEAENQRIKDALAMASVGRTSFAQSGILPSGFPPVEKQPVYWGGTPPDLPASTVERALQLTQMPSIGGLPAGTTLGRTEMPLQAEMAGSPQETYDQMFARSTFAPQVNAQFAMAGSPYAVTPSAPTTMFAEANRPAFPHTPTPKPEQVAQVATQPDVSASLNQPFRAVSTAPQQVTQNVPMPLPRPDDLVAQAVAAASAPTFVATSGEVETPYIDVVDNQPPMAVLPARKTAEVMKGVAAPNIPMPVARPSDVRESNPIASVIDAIKADLAFKEGERINALEASGKTATYPGYSTASDPLAAQRAYLTDIGLDPNNPADMAKVKARIIQQDGQDKVDYYTKSLGEALFGTPSEEQKVAAALNVAREGGGGGGVDRTPVQQAAIQAPTVTPPPYMTELSEGNLALPHPEGLSAQQWANKYAGGDINKVHARIKFIKGAPRLEYYTV